MLSKQELENTIKKLKSEFIDLENNLLNNYTIRQSNEKDVLSKMKKNKDKTKELEQELCDFDDEKYYFYELGFNEYKSERLSELKNKNINIIPLLKYKNYDDLQFAVLFGGFKSGVDITQFDNQNYDYLLMKKIRVYLENNQKATSDDINLFIIEN